MHMIMMPGLMMYDLKGMEHATVAQIFPSLFSNIAAQVLFDFAVQKYSDHRIAGCAGGLFDKQPHTLVIKV